MKFHAEMEGYRVQWRAGPILSARVWAKDCMLALPFMPIATAAEGRAVLEERVAWLVQSHHRSEMKRAYQSGSLPPR
jgi:hypothetical protein